MSAVRMVAYGVLELRFIAGSDDLWVQSHGREASEVSEHNDQIRKAVNDELARYGLLLRREVIPHKNRYRTSKTGHVLYGQLGGVGFKYREALHVGDFRECCIKAAKLLDELDAAQVPDTATGND